MPPVVIVGAGLAGLSCAVSLHRAGRDVLVLERQQRVGGRVQSELVNGCIIDRGFQVLLDSYPAARQLLDLEALQLGRFRAGALVRTPHRIVRIVDPFREPLGVFDTIASGTFTLADLWRVVRLRRTATQPDPAHPHETTLAFLRRRGFSALAIERFFRPFFSGVMLDDHLETPAAFFRFVFAMFTRGGAGLPAAGMGAIPAQLAGGLPDGAVRTETAVREVHRDRVVLAHGEAIAASAVVLAVEPATAAVLLGAGNHHAAMRGCTSVTYAAPRPPHAERTLVINASGRGVINSVAVSTNVAPSYAPAGVSLVTVTVLGSDGYDNAALDGAIRVDLEDWFGQDVIHWKRLAIHRVPGALPVRFGTGAHLPLREAAAERGIHLAGDYLVTPSIDGAMQSGLGAATALTG